MFLVARETFHSLERNLQTSSNQASVEEDRHLVNGRSTRWLEDEEESIRFVVVVNWNQARIHLAEAEGNIGKRVNNISYTLWSGLMRGDMSPKIWLLASCFVVKKPEI